MKDEHLIEIKEEKKETKEEARGTENFATEIFRTFNAHSRFVTRGLLIAVIISSAIWAAVFFWNDQKWRDLFNSYDYISQDGEGINNVNSGSQGSLNNGSEE